MPPRLADYLNAARRRHFVGRIDEQALFRAALTAAELPYYVLYISGPGGVGKSTLLGEFVHICQETQTAVIHIDARNLEPSPVSFLHAIRAELGLVPSAPLFQGLAPQAGRQVILIDTFEKLASLEGWLWEEFLPQLPGNVLVVVAGRHPAPARWRVDPGWQSLIQPLSLRNFSPSESLTYLANRAVPSEQHKAILHFTYGHPLALSLIADVFAQRGQIDFKPEAAPDVIKTLLEQLVQKVPGPAHRAALEACALVRMTTEPLLAEMLATPDAHELFEWLRGLSCIEFGPFGLFPHDLARETLLADLRWRNPDWYGELHRRARTYYAGRLQQVKAQEQQTILIDYIFLHRDNPIIRPFFIQMQQQWQEDDASIIIDVAHESEWPVLRQMISQHEGAESARLAQHWFGLQPDHVLVLRDAAQKPAGLLTLIALDQAGAADIDADPATRAAWHYLENHAPLRPGEQATHFRFWLVKDTYQQISAVQALLFVQMVRHYLTTPGLAFTFLPCAQPGFWTAIFAYADLKRLSEADFEVEGRHYGVFGHDWRAVPPMAWLDLLAERETALQPQPMPGPPVKERLLVLSRSDFKTAVRQALNNMTQPESLQDNPLIKSRLIVDRTGVDAPLAERITALQTLLKETATSLQAAPREMKFYRALQHTYFQPAPTQEQAAELLDVPFSTFRRHLNIGIGRITEILWQQEIGGLKK